MLPPAGGQVAPLPPGKAGGSNVCPYAPAIHKGKVVPLRGLHLAFCLASHGLNQRRLVGCRGVWRPPPPFPGTLGPHLTAPAARRVYHGTRLAGRCGFAGLYLNTPQLTARQQAGGSAPALLPFGRTAVRWGGLFRAGDPGAAAAAPGSPPLNSDN